MAAENKALLGNMEAEAKVERFEKPRIHNTPETACK
jgi:hypothetical protein